MELSLNDCTLHVWIGEEEFVWRRYSVRALLLRAAWITTSTALTHNVGEFFIPPVGPRFIGHFYDHTPDSCFPTDDAVHVVVVAAGTEGVDDLLLFVAHFAEMSKKGYFPTQIYMHFVVDKDNRAVATEWRSNFHNVDGHIPKHAEARNPDIVAVGNLTAENIPPKVCGVLHYFEHMCSHRRLTTRMPQSQDDLNTEEELQFRVARCRHNYNNMKAYFDTEVSDLLDPPTFVVVAQQWHPAMLNIPSLTAVADRLSGGRAIALHATAKEGVSRANALRCGGVFSENAQRDGEGVTPLSSICAPADAFLIVSFNNASIFADMEQVVLREPLETNYVSLLWNKFGDKHFVIMPSHMLYYVEPSALSSAQVSPSEGPACPNSAPLSNESHSFSNIKDIKDVKEFQKSVRAVRSPLCPGMKLTSSLVHIVGRQWVDGDSGMFCDIMQPVEASLSPIENISDATAEIPDEDVELKGSTSTEHASPEFQPNPYIAILDNTAFGICAAARLTDLNYSNWILLTSYLSCETGDTCKESIAQWQRRTPNGQPVDCDPGTLHSDCGFVWTAGSSAVLEDEVMSLAPHTGTSRLLRRNAKSYYSFLLDRLLSTSLWRYDSYFESPWNETDTAAAKYLRKRFASGTKKDFGNAVKFPPLHARRTRLRRLIPNISSALDVSPTEGLWNSLFADLNKDRIIGGRDKPLHVSRLLPDIKTVLFGRDNVYSMKYDTLLTALPINDVRILADHTVSADDSDWLPFGRTVVTVVNFLVCGTVLPHHNDIVSTFHFSEDDIIFNRLTLDRRPHVDPSLIAARRACGSEGIASVSVDVSSSDTVFVPHEDRDLMAAVEQSLSRTGILDSSGSRNKIVHVYDIRRVDMGPHDIPSESASRVLDELRSLGINHISQYRASSQWRDGLDAGRSLSPLDFGYSESLCLAGVRMVENALLQDRPRVNPDTHFKKDTVDVAVDGSTEADDSSVIHFLPDATQMAGSVSPPFRIELTSYIAPVLSLPIPFTGPPLEKRTSLHHARRIESTRKKEKDAIDNTERVGIEQFAKFATQNFQRGAYQVNVFNVSYGLIDKMDINRKWVDEGDYHVWRPTLPLGISLHGLAGSPHPSSLALLAHLTFIVDNYDDLANIVVFSEPTITTDYWYYGSSEHNKLSHSMRRGVMSTNIISSPHIGIYSDLFDEGYEAGVDVLLRLVDTSVEPFNVVEQWRSACRSQESDSKLLCRGNRSYHFYASRSLLRVYSKQFYLRLLNDLKDLNEGDLDTSRTFPGADAGLLLAALIGGPSRACSTREGAGSSDEGQASLRDFWGLYTSGRHSTRFCADYLLSEQTNSFPRVHVYPLLMQSSRIDTSEVLYNEIFASHMKDTPRPVLRSGDMARLQNSGLHVYIYSLPPRFHRHWLDMGSTILCWQDHPWDRTPCNFLKGPHRSGWPRQRVVCSDGDPSKKLQQDVFSNSTMNKFTISRSCQVQNMPEREHEMMKRAYHLSAYRTTDPGGEIVLLMKLLLSLRHMTVTADPARADLFLMPYLSSSASFIARNIKATPDLSDGPFPLSTLLEHLPHLNPSTQHKHLLLATSECIGCIAAEPGCVCCEKRTNPVKDFTWDWQVCGPHLLEEMYPNIVRTTLGPRRHGDQRHIIVPSLILDADLQPGPFPGGGSDYSVSDEEIDRYEEELNNTGRDVYVKSGGINSVFADEAGVPLRPLFLSVFTTFHPNLNSIFEQAMSTRERLVVSILSYLRRHGHVVNSTNLVQYASLFENEIDNDAPLGSLPEKVSTVENEKIENILVYVGDLTAKITFPTRRTFHHVYRKSVFCPIPPGDVPHGSRFFHAILCGCIPVVLTFNASVPGFTSWHMDQGAPYIDSYPFTNKIDYRRIVVEVPGKDIDRLVEILQEVRQDVVRSKQQYISEVRNMFVHDYSGGVADSFSYLLPEIVKRFVE